MDHLEHEFYEKGWKAVSREQGREGGAIPAESVNVACGELSLGPVLKYSLMYVHFILYHVHNKGIKSEFKYQFRCTVHTAPVADTG